MAIRIRLAGTALARVRFAVSPLFETVMAADVLCRPGAHAVHLPWVSWARPRLNDVADLALLRAVVDDPVKPAYLMPVPDDRLPDLDAEVRRVRATTSEAVRRDLDRRGGRLQRELRELYTNPRTGLARLAAAIHACHRVLVLPYWPRIARVLEADITHRAGILATGGIEALFTGLHPEVAWADGELTLLRDRPHRPTTVDLTGRGLVMSPSAFAWPRTWTAIQPRAYGILRYPARGVGAIWEPGHPAPDAVAALIGRTRAALLGLLGAPATTGELARRLHVTPGAVSQHLNVLRDAGLVATHRTGRTVVHLRTATGDALLHPA
jgi:DNA-binding transcriptional ArsR family regulator